jgi:signal transduction histidine kinase
VKIKIISEDSELQRMCRDILLQLRVHDLEIIAEGRSPSELPCDICVWDCSSTGGLPDFPISDYRKSHLFLVERRQIRSILDKLPREPIGLLLKPVSKSTLAAFLEQAVARCAAWDGVRHPECLGVGADRDDMLQYLLQANLRLQEYDHDRTNFLARALHDFRAPLTALNGYCGLLLEGLLGPLTVEQKEVIRRLEQSGKRLGRMSSSMYALTLGRQVRQPPKLQEYPIEDCIQQAIYELAAISRGKDISISVDLSPSPCPLSFEPTQFEQLLINLLENACRFTPRHGSIEIVGGPSFWERRSCPATGVLLERRRQHSDEPNVYRVDITDSGPGIPESFLPLIFEEYTSYSGPDDRSGGGLGLAICRTIVQSHQGSIWATSGKSGVTFSFVFPLRLAECSADLPSASIKLEKSEEQLHACATTAGLLFTS